MRRPLRACLGALVPTLAARSAQACDPARLPISRLTGIAFFVATATGPEADGQRAQLQVAGGSGATLRPGPVLLIPWRFGPDCRPLRWDAGQAWQPPSTVAFYTGRLRPQAEWQLGLPTFDVEMAWREPMWQTEAPPFFANRGGQPLLTPVEFFDFYESLPTEEELNANRQAALTGVSTWAAKHPALALREPAQSIIANLKRALSARTPRPYQPQE